MHLREPVYNEWISTHVIFILKAGLGLFMIFNYRNFTSWKLVTQCLISTQEYLIRFVRYQSPTIYTVSGTEILK